MHTVQEEPEEFLGVLLAVTRELSCHSTHLVLEGAGSHAASFGLSGRPEKFTIALAQILFSQLLIRLELTAQEILGQGSCCKNAL